MLQNSIEVGLNNRLVESGLSLTDVAEKVGVSLSCVDCITMGREKIMNRTFVKMMDETRL